MAGEKKPLVSVVIPNYNGKKFLSECFSALSKIDFPKDKYEVILVDNNSTDLSVKYTKENFPNVKIVESVTNLGFAGGCNLGVKNSLGKYVALLNNDTHVDVGWLKYLVKTIQSDKKIAVVNSKLFLYYPFVEIIIRSDIHLKSEFIDSINFQSVGILLENVVLGNYYLQRLVRYKSGFYEKEEGIITTRWTTGEGCILIPCDPNAHEQTVTLTVRAEKSNSNLKTQISILCGGVEMVSDKLSSFEVKQYTVRLKTSEVTSSFVYAVQNSGLIVFKSGYGRDRGAVAGTVQGHFYELDSPFYNKRAELNAFSGASALIDKNVFVTLGGFDESFFMYYEDLDLSLRMKRMGWRIVYEPRSLVYHIHSGSSGEWSALFLYNVEKNRLATLVKHFPATVVAREFIWYFFLVFLTMLKVIKWRFKEHWELYDDWREKLGIRLRVILWIFTNFILFINKRIVFTSQGKKTVKQIYDGLY